MATIKFFIKTVADNSIPKPLEPVFFRYRPSRELDVLLKTPYEICPNDWDEVNQCWYISQIVKKARLQEVKSLNDTITAFNSNIDEFRLSVCRYIDTLAEKDSDAQKHLIKDFVLKTYFAHRIKIEKKVDPYKSPNNFSDLIDFYIEQRSIEDNTKNRNKKPLAYNTIKKYRTLQNLLKRFNSKLEATMINDIWRNAFVDWLNKQNYSTNTKVKFLKDIKMLCVYANKHNKISKEVLAWEIDAKPSNVSEYIAFTFNQLDTLNKAIMPSDRLDNARDLFLISCYTSVRVSELMTMKAENIQRHGEDCFIEVIEKKNINHKSSKKIIYLLPQVIKILNKRNGEFPRKLSDQRYNEYIKEVCEKAGLTHEIEHGIMENKRKVVKKLPFYKAVTSHSGRATFITLFSDKLPSEIMQMQTNHQSNEMLEHYNKTAESDKLMQRAKTFASAFKSLDEYEPVKLKIV